MDQDDLYSLDAPLLNTMKPIHALIFLFKYVGQGEGEEKSGVEVDPLESGVWFANQASWLKSRTTDKGLMGRSLIIAVERLLLLMLYVSCCRSSSRELIAGHEHQAGIQLA
jgi:hypothetical protein